MTITGEESTATVFHHGKSAEAVVFQLIDPFGMMKPFSQLLLRCGLFPVCPSSDHDPEWCAPGGIFQQPSLPQPGECSLQNRIVGHSSILTRVTRIALPLASGPNISASPSAKPDANCGNAPEMFGR
jgi:hypothetical protein